MNNDTANKSFFAIACSQKVVMSAIKVALFVGTMLALINHGEKILNLSLSGDDYFKVFLTYLVPYGVSTWSAVKAIKSKD